METPQDDKTTPEPSGSEWLRGLKESASKIEVLRSLWPNAFPQKGELVRPLASGLIGQIVERTGWSFRYTAGVLRGWKLRRAYCNAILRHDHRFNLEGEEVAENLVEDQAREQARKQLERIAARQAKKRREKRKAKSKHRAPGKAGENRKQAKQPAASSAKQAVKQAKRANSTRK